MVLEFVSNEFSERRSWQKHRRRLKMFVKYVLSKDSMILCVFLFCFLPVINVSASTIISDECDWTGSGLETGDGRGVTPLYLRCATGRVTWLYPRGALRALLRLPTGREFRACVRMRGDVTTARTFLEGRRSLHPLHTDANVVRCFQSKNGQAALYIEATDWLGIERREVQLDYDLQSLPKDGKSYDLAEECRPCTAEEMAHAFCTSDLVSRGIIRTVENHDTMDISQLSVKVTKLIRHTSDISDDFMGTTLSTTTPSPGVHTTPQFSINANLIDEIDPVLGSPTQGVNILVPTHCGAAHGEGEFVFMARRKLGDLTLQCAPRLEDWVKIMRTFNDQGKAHCVLKS